MNAQLLLIDPQNDFCDLPPDACPPGKAPALPVPGAHEDMRRLAAFLDLVGARLDGIAVTLDSHASVAIERTTFWRTGDGGEVAPFTQVTAQDVRAGRFQPRDATLGDAVVSALEALEAGGRHTLVVWPVHCVTGTWGHNIHDAVAEALARWELHRQRPVRKVLKGEYPLSEHYGVFEAEVPVPGVTSTQFNHQLAEQLTQGVDLLLVAGEAASHCVAASVQQLLRGSRQRPRIVLLSDCMSPVAGFEPLATCFYDEVAAQGVQRMTAAQAAQLL